MIPILSQCHRRGSDRLPRRYLQEDDGGGSQTEARDPLSDH